MNADKRVCTLSRTDCIHKSLHSLSVNFTVLMKREAPTERALTRHTRETGNLAAARNIIVAVEAILLIGLLMNVWERSSLQIFMIDFRSSDYRCHVVCYVWDVRHVLFT